MFLPPTTVAMCLAGSAYLYGSEAVVNENNKKQASLYVEYKYYSDGLDIHLNPITVEVANIILKNQINAALVQLSDIGNLSENWNEHNASSFSPSLIDKCRDIILKLTAIPQIYPVANGSIQLEYYKTKGALLEFNVYEDRITMFKKIKKMENGEFEKISNSFISIDELFKEVDMFYECI